MGHWCESGGDSIFSNTCVNRKTSLSEADGSFHSRINHLPVTKCPSWGKVILSTVRSLPVGYPAAGTIFFTQHTDPLVISILERPFWKSILEKTIHGKSTAMHLFYLKPTELGSRAWQRAQTHTHTEKFSLDRLLQFKSWLFHLLALWSETSLKMGLAIVPIS